MKKSHPNVKLIQVALVFIGNVNVIVCNKKTCYTEFSSANYI